jgi:short-subunit dehydrogenase involved in D-alanine esterification of teichoic acids
MLRVEKLPKIESYTKLMKELEECRTLSEDIKSECPDINILVNKLY